MRTWMVTSLRLPQSCGRSQLHMHVNGVCYRIGLLHHSCWVLGQEWRLGSPIPREGEPRIPPYMWGSGEITRPGVVVKGSGRWLAAGGLIPSIKLHDEAGGVRAL